MSRTLPPACVPVQVGAVLYQQCGNVWYQPQYVGTNVHYTVVNPPRGDGKAPARQGLRRARARRLARPSPGL